VTKNHIKHRQRRLAAAAQFEMECPFNGTLEKDGIDSILGAADRAIGHSVRVGCRPVA
jgi:hypothetical protein